MKAFYVRHGSTVRASADMLGWTGMDPDFAGWLEPDEALAKFGWCLGTTDSQSTSREGDE